MELQSLLSAHAGNRLETRVYGLLMRHGITTVELLKSKTDNDLLRIKGIGKCGLAHIHNKLLEL